MDLFGTICYLLVCIQSARAYQVYLSIYIVISVADMFVYEFFLPVATHGHEPSGVKKDGQLVEIEFAPKILERRFLSSELTVMTKQYHRKMPKSR